MQKKSIISNLAVLTQYVSEVLADRGQVDVVNTNIQKAFDQIDHNILYLFNCKLNFVDFMLLVLLFLLFVVDFYIYMYHK